MARNNGPIAVALQATSSNMSGNIAASPNAWTSVLAAVRCDDDIGISRQQIMLVRKGRKQAARRLRFDFATKRRLACLQGNSVCRVS